MPVTSIRLYALILFALIFGMLATAAYSQHTLPEGHNKNSPLGTNLAGITDWSTQYPFNDLFKTSRPWISGSSSQWNDKRSIDVDSHGWVTRLKPGRIARTIMLVDNLSTYFPGRYIVEYEGQGKIIYGGAGRVDQEHSKPGKHIVDVTPRQGGGFFLEIHETDPGDYIRNIRVYKQGHAPKEHGLFNKNFIESLHGFRAVRFMDWQVINDTKLQYWEDRPRLSDARWRHEGAPIAVLVALANQAKVDPWFCMPHTADDDYVQRFAQQVANNLESGRTIYIEHSNEVWNNMFAASKYAQDNGLKLGHTENRWHAGWQYYSKRSVEIFSIWSEVIDPNKHKLVRVMGGFAANAWGSERALEFNDAYKHTDAIAIAPYFGGSFGSREQASKTRQMSSAELLKQLTAISLPRALANIEKHGILARKYNVDLIAYEGGQHLAAWHVQPNDSINKLFDDVNRQPEMGKLYQRYLTGWKKSGGQLFMHFTDIGRWSKWGRFSHFEYLGQPASESPRYQVMMRFIKEHPQWWTESPSE
ncbi:hypothetical protein [Poriferisphaera sp. WC338]|uniref:hypothetical protein n=1 Tax=Poriferisphaera sp. WC338 TaxID=3425129 RepID=UPI003D819266